MRSERFMGTIPGECGTRGAPAQHLSAAVGRYPSRACARKTPTRPSHFRMSLAAAFRAVLRAELVTCPRCHHEGSEQSQQVRRPCESVLHVHLLWGRGTPHLTYGGRGPLAATPFRVWTSPVR